MSDSKHYWRLMDEDTEHNAQVTMLATGDPDADLVKLGHLAHGRGLRFELWCSEDPTGAGLVREHKLIGYFIPPYLHAAARVEVGHGAKVHASHEYGLVSEHASGLRRYWDWDGTYDGWDAPAVIVGLTDAA